MIIGNIFSRGYLLILTIAVSSRGVAQAVAQPAITGPTCVIPGTTYQYLISGQWDVGSTMQVCTKGAVILSTNGACTVNGSPIAAVQLNWNTGINSGSLSLSSTNGNASLAISITTPLKAGSIVTTSKLQSIAFRALPGTIHCNPDTGGFCKPVYTHQWQQSLDNIHWVDVGQAVATDLLVSPVQEQTIFFRRKTVETQSRTIAYSDVAAVIVGAPPPGTSAFSSAGANPK
jgi:hypothetical protein